MRYTNLSLSLLCLITAGCQTSLDPLPPAAHLVITSPPPVLKPAIHEEPRFQHAEGQLTGQHAFKGRLWRTLIEPEEKGGLPASPPLAQGRTLFVLDLKGGVQAFRSGKPLWRSTVEPPQLPYEAQGAGGLALSGDQLAVTTPWGDLAVLEARTGKLLWRAFPSSPARGAPWWSHDRVSVTTATQRLESFHHITGKPLGWDPQVATTASLWNPSHTSANPSIVVMVREPHTLMALNPCHANPLWSYAIPQAPTFALLPSLKSTLDNSKIFFSGLQTGCLDAFSGEVLWRLPVTTFTVPLVCGNMVIVCSPEHIMALSTASGHVFWRHKVVPGFQHRHMTSALAGDRLYVPHPEGLLVLKALSGDYVGKIAVPGAPYHVTVTPDFLVVTTQEGGTYLYI